MGAVKYVILLSAKIRRIKIPGEYEVAHFGALILRIIKYDNFEK